MDKTISRKTRRHDQRVDRPVADGIQTGAAFAARFCRSHGRRNQKVAWQRMSYDLPRIAVIIPTYNRASLVTRAIESVLAQTYTNYELVVVDDGSEDNTLEIVKQYTGCRYVRLEHSGLPSVARNAGVRSTDTPYVAFLDSDDEWLPGKLTVQTEILESNPDVGLVCSNAFVM